MNSKSKPKLKSVSDMRPVTWKLEEISFFGDDTKESTNDFDSSSISSNLSGAFIEQRKQVSRFLFWFPRGNLCFTNRRDRKPLSADLFLMIQDPNFLTSQ